MNGVSLTTVGQLLGNSKVGTTNGYVHLDDAALQDAGARAAAVIASAMNYLVEPSPPADRTGDHADSYVSRSVGP